jgi:hypothetical protein
VGARLLARARVHSVCKSKCREMALRVLVAHTCCAVRRHDTSPAEGCCSCSPSSSMSVSRALGCCPLL